MNIQKRISNIIAIAFISTLFIFAFTWIIFDFQNSANALKNTWSIVSSLFGGITTLIAAYIASLYFNDWKEQHNKEIRNKFALQIYDCYVSLTNSILDFGLQIEGIQPPKKTYIPFLATKNSRNLLNEFEKLNQHYDKVNIQISYLLDRLREFGIITKQEFEIQTHIQEYLNIYETLIETNMSEATTIEEIILIYNKIYEDYGNLRNKIYTLTVEQILKELQANK